MADGRDDPPREAPEVGVDGLSQAGGAGPQDVAEAVAPTSDAERLTVTVDPRSGIWIVAGIITLAVLAAFFEATQRSLTVIGVGVLLAFALEPLVLAVQRRTGMGRGSAVGVVGTGLAVAISALVVIVGPAAIQQAQDFGQELPDTLQEIEQLPVVGPRLADADFATRVEDWVEGLPGRLDTDGVESAARSVLSGVVDGLGVLLVALVVLIDGPTLVARLRLFVPHRHRDRADAVGRVFYRVVGTYFAGSLFVASIGGTWVLVVGLLVGVPLAPVAAVWYAVVSLIPQIGGFLGTSFVTILALTQGVVPALVVLVLVVGYMNLENYVITPAIVGEAVDLSPPVTMLAALVGGAAAGVPGALAATPLCGTIKAVYMEARFGEPPPAPSRVRDRVPAPLRKAVDRVRGHDDDDPPHPPPPTPEDAPHA